MYRILVTGGAGFIGSNFIFRALDKLDCKILNIDKLTYSGNLDNLSEIKPSKYAIENMQKGLNTFKTIGKADIGQSIIIQNQLILGIESIEGTDELMRRCEIYKKDGDKGILLKLSKYKQDGKLDLPTIGLETVKILFKCNYEGVFIEKDSCVIIEKEKVIKFCNENQLFLSTVKKID